MILLFVGLVVGFAVDHFFFQSGKAGMVTKIEEELTAAETMATAEVKSLIKRVRAVL